MWTLDQRLSDRQALRSLQCCPQSLPLSSALPPSCTAAQDERQGRVAESRDADGPESLPWRPGGLRLPVEPPAVPSTPRSPSPGTPTASHRVQAEAPRSSSAPRGCPREPLDGRGVPDRRARARVALGGPGRGPPVPRDRHPARAKARGGRARGADRPRRAGANRARLLRAPPPRIPPTAVASRLLQRPGLESLRDDELRCIGRAD